MALADRHVIVVDLGFGDAGKGATVDWLCANGSVAAVVRFNGGAQAAHNVIADGRHHRFSQFGAGTLTGTPTLLSRHMLVEPIALATESVELARLGVPDPLGLLHIDGDALLTTPIHVAANRAREDARGAARHGSCGKGIGETAAYALTHRAPTVADCRDPAELARLLDALARHYEPLIGDRFDSVTALVTLYRDFAAATRIVTQDALATFAAHGRLVFEGAQGVLLDEWRGLHPHTTWSTVEPRYARAMIAALGERPYVLGVTRTYLTRHGAGPFPTEDKDLRLPEPHNATGEYQGAFRVGHFDPILLRYAIEASGGIDGLAVTHLDQHTNVRSATAYNTPDGIITALPCGPWQDLTHQAHLTRLLATARPILEDLPDPATTIPTHLQVPVVLTSHGPDRLDRRLPTTAGAAR
ncbi:adenylosuccinate synthetase [Kutzneria buriramensis]|uniref:Adenylosuccinate synthetase n=1 Tax=Kutzneria buriramensis TaxID=1045776 RepID=A0A3E0H187_9PSEU|nr:adenylosuccinate synthetase [Kutzneria buriramensis]REH35810.1 adenylosuccinate synthase [Kutzneria buriramensis]